MITVFLKIAMIFLMAGVGFVACKRGILPLESKKYFVDLMMKITCPCMIFASLVSRELNHETVRIMKEIFIGSIIFFVACIIFSYIIVKMLHYKDKEDEGILMVLVTSLNTGFMGFPITRAIFGEMYFFLMVLENIILNIYLYIVSLLQINYGHADKSGNNRWKSLISPNTIAMIFGIIVLAMKLSLPEFATDFFGTMGDATVPLSMIILGIQLCESNFKEIIKNRALLIVSFFNIIIVPAITFAVVNFMPLMTESKLILVFASAFPCAVVPVAIAMQEGRNSKLMAEGVALTTLISVITLPIWAMILIKVYL